MIHLIPTEKPSNIYQTKNIGLMYEEYPDKTINAGNQFLVITDNSEFKAGDYVVWNNSNTVEKVKTVGIDLVTFDDENRQGYIENCKKIVASNSTEITPKSLISNTDIVISIKYYNIYKNFPKFELMKIFQAFDEQHRKIDYAMIEGDYTKSSLKIVNGNEVMVNWLPEDYQIWLSEIGNEKANELCLQYYGTPLKETKGVDIRYIHAQEVTVHLNHCYTGEYEGSCKYGDEKCPAKTDTNTVETLKEAAQREVNLGKYQDQESAIKFSFMNGAMWQEQRMYSHDEVKRMIQAIYSEFAELDRSRYFPHELKRIIQLEVEKGIKPIKIFK